VVTLVAVGFVSALWAAPEQAPAFALAKAVSFKMVDGVPLVPVTASQKAKCLRFASRIERSTPCPGLLPAPIPIPSDYAGPPCLGEFAETACGPGVIFFNRSLFELSQSNFKVPPSYTGVTFQQLNGAIVPEPSISDGPLGHFVFMTGTDLPADVGNGTRRGASPVPGYCIRQVTHKALRVHGVRATLYQCSDTGGGPDTFELIMGHELLLWKMAGVDVEVSFHGISQVNADLDLAVAESTTVVAPRHQ
jgi:hypothetical protein